MIRENGHRSFGEEQAFVSRIRSGEPVELRDRLRRRFAAEIQRRN
jgi:hypothetical protein